jgi:hypothetical protein
LVFKKKNWVWVLSRFRRFYELVDSIIYLIFFPKLTIEIDWNKNMGLISALIALLSTSEPSRSHPLVLVSPLLQLSAAGTRGLTRALSHSARCLWLFYFFSDQFMWARLPSPRSGS